MILVLQVVKCKNQQNKKKTIRDLDIDLKLAFKY